MLIDPGSRLDRSFYKRDTLTVAKELLGKVLVHQEPEGLTAGMIVETEAYIGPQDPASHAYNGLKSKRTDVQFKEGGFAYVFMIYGVHYCFNVVTNIAQRPEAVLIRALEPLSGVDLMKSRRSIRSKSEVSNINLTNGPGKLCQAMNITMDNYGDDLCNCNLYIADAGFSPERIKETPRINIDYAGDARFWLWRYIIEDNKYISVAG